MAAPSAVTALRVLVTTSVLAGRGPVEPFCAPTLSGPGPTALATAAAPPRQAAADSPPRFPLCGLPSSLRGVGPAGKAAPARDPSRGSPPLLLQLLALLHALLEPLPSRPARLQRAPATPLTQDSKSVAREKARRALPQFPAVAVSWPSVAAVRPGPAQSVKTHEAKSLGSGPTSRIGANAQQNLASRRARGIPHVWLPSGAPLPSARRSCHCDPKRCRSA